MVFKERYYMSVVSWEAVAKVIAFGQVDELGGICLIDVEIP